MSRTVYQTTRTTVTTRNGAVLPSAESNLDINAKRRRKGSFEVIGKANGMSLVDAMVPNDLAKLFKKLFDAY